MPENRSAEARERAQAQMALIRTEFRGYIQEGPPPTDEHRGIHYFVRAGFVLVRDEYADRARALLARAAEVEEEWLRDRETRRTEEGDAGEDPNLPRDGDLAYGIQWVQLPTLLNVFQALEALRTGFWRGRSLLVFADVPTPVPAEAEHLLHVVDTASGCPADEPLPVPPGTPPEPSPTHCRDAGRGIRVLVLDTGFDTRPTTLPWMLGVAGDQDPGIVPPDGATPATTQIERYAGHGTFIAGVVRTMAPEAEVVVRAGLTTQLYAPGQGPGGAQPPHNTHATIFEGQLAKALERYLAEDDPDVISVSAGTRTESPRGLTLLNAFHEEVLRRHKGVVIVAAAGNDGQRSHFWPAASPWTVSVGALGYDWRSRADFSNFGSWVDVYAPGERLVNAFPRGQYRCTEPPNSNQIRLFEGMALWSGTSFSTPVVAGLIAARMSRTGENGPTAAGALLAQAREHAIAGVGAVLTPGRHGSDRCRDQPRERHGCDCDRD